MTAAVLTLLLAALTLALQQAGSGSIAPYVGMAILVELVLLYPSVALQLKQKKIHLFHKKLVDRFERGELAMSATKHELARLYAVNEKLHSRGALLVLSQVIVFLGVLAALQNSASEAAMEAPETWGIPVLAALLVFLHSLIKINAKARQDYLKGAQLTLALMFAVLGAAVMYAFASVFGIALTVYVVLQVALATLRYLWVERHALSWSRLAYQELLNDLRHTPVSNNRFQYLSQRWNHLPVVRHLNFHLLEEALSMSLGLMLALNILGLQSPKDQSLTMNVNQAYAATQFQCPANLSTVEKYSSLCLGKSNAITLGSIPTATDIQSMVSGKSYWWAEGVNLHTGGKTKTDIDPLATCCIGFTSTSTQVIKSACTQEQGYYECAWSYDVESMSISQCPTQVELGSQVNFSLGGNAGVNTYVSAAPDSVFKWSTSLQPVTQNGNSFGYTAAQLGDETITVTDTVSLDYAGVQNKATCSFKVIPKAVKITNCANFGDGFGLPASEGGLDSKVMTAEGKAPYAWSLAGTGSINVSTGQYSTGGATSGSATVTVTDANSTSDTCTFELKKPVCKGLTATLYSGNPAPASMQVYPLFTYRIYMGNLVQKGGYDYQVFCGDSGDLCSPYPFANLQKKDDGSLEFQFVKSAITSTEKPHLLVWDSVAEKGKSECNFETEFSFPSPPTGDKITPDPSDSPTSFEVGG